MKKSIVIIPSVHIFSLLMFFLIFKILIEKETGDKKELFELLHTIDYFSNDVVIVLLISLIITPFGLIVFSILKKQKDLIIGSLLSGLTSLILLILFILS